MFWKHAEKCLKLNYEFLENTYQLLKFDCEDATIVPSVIFLTSSFLLCHFIFHRRTCYHTQLKLFVQREVGFQWTYFYVMRMWMYFVKGSHYAIDWLEKYLMTLQDESDVIWLNPLQLRAVCFSLITSISLVPFTILIMNYLWKENIPNFLMWVGEDPWIRSEIGISGHYLDRPVRFRPPERKEYSYRSRRSSSVDCIYNPTVYVVIRKCRSLQHVSCRGKNSNCF